MQPQRQGPTQFATQNGPAKPYVRQFSGYNPLNTLNTQTQGNKPAFQPRAGPAQSQPGPYVRPERQLRNALRPQQGARLANEWEEHNDEVEYEDQVGEGVCLENEHTPENYDFQTQEAQYTQYPLNTQNNDYGQDFFPTDLEVNECDEQSNFLAQHFGYEPEYESDSEQREYDC